jgi:excisionase family DNA binding protein
MTAARLADQYLTVRQAAERLGWPEGRVRRLIRLKRLPVTRLGWAVLIDVADVERLVTDRPPVAAR